MYCDVVTVELLGVLVVGLLPELLTAGLPPELLVVGLLTLLDDGLLIGPDALGLLLLFPFSLSLIINGF